MGVLAVLALALVIVAHHAEMPVELSGMGQMPGMVHTSDPGHDGGAGHDVGAAAGMVACVAAFVAIGAAVLLLVGALFALVLGGGLAGADSSVWRALSRARAREGPPGPASLCVWRI